MEVRPGYKQTEVGLLPEEWEVKTFGKCLTGRPRYGNVLELLRLAIKREVENT